MEDIISQISYRLFYILKNALEIGFGIHANVYKVILPKWLPQIFIDTNIIAVGDISYPYIYLDVLLMMVITTAIWYLMILITYKALKKLFRLGFGAFGL